MRMMVLIKYTLLSQLRSTGYALMLAISILFGFLCVPAMSDGYQIFYLGGARGIYNSAWLGAISAILPTILLWLPGFYLLRSQISEDRRLGIGQAVASAPISKLRYVGGKFLCNFAVLLSSALIFMVAVIFMQLLRQESMAVQLNAYFSPLIMITVPYLAVLASLTVLMDVVHCLKGVLGNIVVFVAWIILSSVSVAAPGNPLDLFGIGYLLGQMLSGARVVYPGLPEAASFGYYPNIGEIPTFMWTGIVWDLSFVQNRILWIGVALVIVVIAAILFDRFRTPRSIPATKGKTIQPTVLRHVYTLRLAPVLKSSRPSFFALLKGELKLMLSGRRLWWYAISLIFVILSYFVVIADGLQWVCLIMLLPADIWSKMGCREKLSGTSAFIASSCPKRVKWFATLTAGILIALLFSSGILVRFAADGQWQHLISWAIGALFIPTLALVCGTLSGTNRLFEGLYIALLYFGPINNMSRLDFLGVQSSSAGMYLVLTITLALLGATFLSLAPYKKRESYIL